MKKKKNPSRISYMHGISKPEAPIILKVFFFSKQEVIHVFCDLNSFAVHL